MAMNSVCAVLLAAGAIGVAAGPAYATTLDINKYKMTFADDFNAISVSAWGPGTTWIAHTPWNGDFGDAQFSDPQADFPFTVKNGVLRIEVRKRPDGKWAGGLLASVDRSGKGFSQMYGYFEMSAKFPTGDGVWPAFWMIGLDRSSGTAEIDIVEHHGQLPGIYSSATHAWNRAEPSKTVTKTKQHQVPTGSMSARFNVYGVSVDAEQTVFYFNRKEVWRTPTLPSHRQPMYLLVNLGLGGGWAIDKTPNPSFMYVDYVRAYAKK